MTKPLLLASLLLACARAPAGEPIVPPRPPPPATPAKPTGRNGKLVLRQYVYGLAVCAPGAACSALALPDKPTAVVQNGPGRYLASTKDETFAWDAASGALQPLGFGPSVVASLDDGSAIRFEHLSTHSRLLRARGGEPWAVVMAYEKWRPQEFRFLPGGAHLFKDSPGMGGPESPYFTDLVVNHPTHLYVVDAIGGKPRKLHSSSQQMDADFLDGGRRIAFFQPGKVDPQANTRALELSVLDVATRSVSPVAVVITPASVPGGGTRRDAPQASSSLRSTWLVFARTFGPTFNATSLRASDVATGAFEDHPLAPDERLMHAIPHASLYSHQHGRRHSDHIVIAKGHGPTLELSVLAIPSFETIYRVEVPALGLSGADWVAAPD